MNLLERTWYRATPLWPLVAGALLPLAGLFAALSALRRAAYRAGLLQTVTLRAPVVVVGNLTAGGTGKTPLVLWLARALQGRGFTPGILSRGYGRHANTPAEVSALASAADVGDEPLLLARASGCPVWVGADRVKAGTCLLDAHPRCDVLIADDGLQHYRLARRVEIAVVDGQRSHGNGLPLPAGPLREPVSRLGRVDAVVVNAAPSSAPTLAASPPSFAMRLEGTRLRNLARPDEINDLAHFRGKRVHAVAGIGNPQRFFDALVRHGLQVTPHPYPDHHAYRPEDFDFGDDAAVLMTEKDAVKCASLARAQWWALLVEAQLDPGLDELVMERLQGK